MDDLVKQLAAGAGAYLQELRGRDVPLDLSYLLVRDWHQARLGALYGGTQQVLTINPELSPEQTAAIGKLLAQFREVNGISP